MLFRSEDASLFHADVTTEEEDIADAIARIGRSVGLQFQPISFPSSNLARDIREVAHLKKADLVLIGAHRSILGRGPLAGLVREVAEGINGIVAIFLDIGFHQARKVLVIPEGPDEEAVEIVASWLSRKEGIQFTKRKAHLK